ncbi:MAG TPA: hypothetical protein VIH04_05065 [Nitrosarchaeum sp.]
MPRLFKYSSQCKDGGSCECHSLAGGACDVCEELGCESDEW